jgi:ABC-type uncharacterized transport system substrate-binding protein
LVLLQCRRGEVVKRRQFIARMGGALVTIAAPCVAADQTRKRIYRLAILSPGPPALEVCPDAQRLLAALEKYGYFIGQNLVMEGSRGSIAEFSGLAHLVSDLKTENVNVIVTIGYPTAVAAKESGIATVVAYGVGDPIATGLVRHLDRPGGNVTGISDVASTLSTKRLGLLKQLNPKIDSVAIIWNRDDLAMTLRYEAVVKAAGDIGITIKPAGVRKLDDFNDIFALMDREVPDALLMVSDLVTNVNAKRVFDYTAERCIPAIYEYDPLARDGGLMSYGADLTESFDRAASMVHRIFKGQKPGELPFEQPTRYPFVINLRTAKSMKLELPSSLLALADEVLE